MEGGERAALAMVKALFFSIIFHVLVVCVAAKGSFLVTESVDFSDSIINVDIVELAEVTAVPISNSESKPEEKNIGKLNNSSAAELVDTLEPLFIPEIPKVAEELPPQEPKNISSANPRIKAVPFRKPVVDAFDRVRSLVKNLEKKERTKIIKQTASEEVNEGAQSLVTQNADRATLSERDAIRRHIEGCWRIDPGKEGVLNLRVVLKVFINSDGTVRQAIIQDTGRYFSDPIFRTFADSARTAVLRCNNIPVSPVRYQIFKEILFTFSPKERLN